MKGLALYTVTIDWIQYIKGKMYDLKNQITIAWKNYFLIEEVETIEQVKEVIKSKKK
jgi:hypothetical protein